MDHETALAEAARRQAAEPGATFTTVKRDGTWAVARIGVPHARPSGTATKPPPEAPQEGPSTQPGLDAYLR